jgi:hypothetical protein
MAISAGSVTVPRIWPGPGPKSYLVSQARTSLAKSDEFDEVAERPIAGRHGPERDPPTRSAASNGSPHRNGAQRSSRTPVDLSATLATPHCRWAQPSNWSLPLAPVGFPQRNSRTRDTRAISARCFRIRLISSRSRWSAARRRTSSRIAERTRRRPAASRSAVRTASESVRPSPRMILSARRGVV